jgi:flagellar basal body-associated protein FliL
MKKKLMIAVPILLVVVGGAYKFMGPKAKAAPAKLGGEIYVLPKQFTLNLKDGHFATMTVALELAPGQSDGASATASGGDSSTGIGTLPEEAAIRAIVTNIVTNQNQSALITATGRARIEHQILVAIGSKTDDKVTQVMLPDVAVQ